MVAPGKGILAIDETARTCTKRFVEAGIESTEESRRAYREMLVTTPGLSQYVSGAILFDETLRQGVADGRSFAERLSAEGMVPGIKVDKGTKPIPDSAGELITEGLEGIDNRLEEYRQMGARFTKWRAVLRIGDGLPGHRAIEGNAKSLGSYAKLAQEAGLVPIVEPEVLMDGDHGIARCQEATEAVLSAVFEELRARSCQFEGMVLKPNMVISGSGAPTKDDAAEVAARTVETLRRCVPAQVPGIAFLSGGQTGPQACANLNAMVALGPLPWELSFSFGRALQYPALEIWGGNPDNAPAAQAAFLHRAKMSSLARSGTYNTNAERHQD
jgi:fructose-bisphosphate aldolase class I